MRNHSTASLLLGLLTIVLNSGLTAAFRTNVLQPYNILLWAQRYYPARWGFDIAFQSSVASDGFAVVEISRCAFGQKKLDELKGSCLQLFQPDQNVIASLFNAPEGSELAMLANAYHRNVDNGQAEVYRPQGSLRLPINLPFAAHVQVVDHLWIDTYWNYLMLELADVAWYNISTGQVFEAQVDPSLLHTVAGLTKQSLTGWRKHGFGDGSIQLRWQHDFYQDRPFLKNVRLSVRTGLILPTGTKTDPYELLGIPLGNDLGVGILGAGFFVLEFPDKWSFMLDLEFTQFLGNTHMRRIPTDEQQSDLLFPRIAQVYVDPGFTQQYTFIGMKRFWNNGLILSAAYQYYKHNDDTLYPCDYTINPQPLNAVQSAQEWTTHQMMFQARYAWAENETCGFKPEVGIFGIYGFNGKRAVILSSVGAMVSFGW
jgi:hypothetical protein